MTGQQSSGQHRKFRTSALRVPLPSPPPSPLPLRCCSNCCRFPSYQRFSVQTATQQPSSYGSSCSSDHHCKMYVRFFVAAFSITHRWLRQFSAETGSAKILSCVKRGAMGVPCPQYCPDRLELHAIATTQKQSSLPPIAKRPQSEEVTKGERSSRPD